MASTLKSRATVHELLDAEHLDPRELALNLREMAMLNRLPGGTADSLRATARLLDGHVDPQVLDAGTGSGDYVRRLRRVRPARVLAVDRHPEVLAVAARNLRGIEGVKLLQADVRSLPLPDAAVDVAHASLLLHHLDPPDAVAALRELGRVARRGVIVNDLRRGTLAFALSAAVVLALTRGRYTRHDGVLSARRAYTMAELDDLAASAGLRPTWRSAAFLPRVTTVLQ